MDYCNKCGGDPDEVGELTEWHTMNVCKSCLVNEHDYALYLEEVNEDLRAQLAEAREAARVLMHAALTRTSIVSLEQIHAIDTVEKWEGK
jgi:hypothetical protein